ncbi:RNA polymerase sigma factor [uncultured Desulfosarcina sp.]|uniref:RNA polymerase sigma factor n=1 Tax=uncultured Desulfosarcina sp. TaxID=218289 RepID=UPI0029C68C8C|nr:RNA polymerase sigma factor [uncultured Desulfosarcina sp.]
MRYQQPKCDPPGAEVDDAAVIDRVLKGDTDAFALLMNKYGAMVVNRIKYHVPEAGLEETVQDAFTRAYRSLGTCRDRKKFKAWLSSIAVKAAYDYLRKQYRCKETAVSKLNADHRDWLEHVSIQQSEEAYHRRLARREAREVLDWALSRLPVQDRMVLELVHLQEIPVKEAAELLGWSAINVKVRSHRSRKKLKAIMEELIDREKEML